MVIKFLCSYKHAITFKQTFDQVHFMAHYLDYFQKFYTQQLSKDSKTSKVMAADENEPNIHEIIVISP